MRDHVVFDSIPIDQLVPGSRYEITRRGMPSIAGRLSSLQYRPGQPIGIVMCLAGGEFHVVPADEVERIQQVID